MIKAADRGHREMVDLLIGKGAKLDLQCWVRRTCFTRTPPSPAPSR